MSRRELREHLFRMLFRKDFHDPAELEEQINYYMETMNELIDEDADNQDQPICFKDLPDEGDLVYLNQKFDKIIEKLDDIDAMLEEASSGWKLNRMGRVDLCILRLAVYEMKYDEEVPVKVAINEAVEIAKKYGEDQSPGFINGILAKLADE